MILTKNIDAHPYTGIRNVTGKIKLLEKRELYNYRFTEEELESIAKEKNLTYGNVYEVTKVEGFGDCEDVFILNNIGEEVDLGDFFFEENYEPQESEG